MRPALVAADAAASVHPSRAVQRANPVAQTQLFLVHRGERTERHLATAFEHAQQRALGAHRQARHAVIERGQPAQGGLVIRACADADHSLRHGRRPGADAQVLGDLRRQAEALQPRGGENDRIVVTLLQALDACRHVAAQLEQHHIRTGACQERAAPQAAGADARTLRQRAERRAARADQRIARVLARQRCGKLQTGLEPGREILETVHRDIHRAGEQRAVDLLGEERLALHLPQRHIALHVPFGPDVHQLHGRCARLRAHQALDVPRLPQRERRGARADAQRLERAHGSPSLRKR